MKTDEIKKKTVKIIIAIAVVLLLGVTFYVYASLNWSYSKGDRVGYVQKFSDKGWVIKTWEGELQMLPVPGAMPEKFPFSVRRKDIITKLKSSLGKKVSITYEQHKGKLNRIFGESEYFIVDVRLIND
ncbi:MAG: hypothetical protein WCP33_02250 [Deltaproteobacteria bacterium]